MTRARRDQDIDLLNKLEEDDIQKIHDAFATQEGKQFDRDDLRHLLFLVSKLIYDDDEFDELFNKINSKRDGFVTWNEFISFLILCFEQKEVKCEYKTLEAPIPVLPRILKSDHRHTINSIVFAPTVKPDRTISWHDGSLLTCSKDGVISYRSLDLQLERTVVSTCPYLKVAATWVLTIASLPDVYVVCTSSTERDLRFYDTSARKFELRVMMTALDYAVTAMCYHFETDANEESKLIFGDQAGVLKIIYLSSIGRGPFKSKPGIPLLSVCFSQVVNGEVAGFRVVDFGRKHTDFVRQISYYSTLHSIISCAQCPKASVLLTDVTLNGKEYAFKIPKGVWCYAFDDSAHVIATGSPDCLVRVWNTFVTNRPSVVFYGHHTGIVQMVLQDNAKQLYSLSRDRCVKVWDIASQSCMQTYLGIPAELGEHSDISALYNPEGRQWILGSTMLAVLPLDPKLNAEHTDGNTHSAGVSVVIYNPLFKMVITCGLDSCIIMWNPWDGRRMQTIREAHIKSFHGEIIPIEITAACFDPGYQRLLTGAHDGSLKIWNFHSGTCMRNMRLDKGCEVKSVIWVSNRIMAIGWNRRITEFSDSDLAVGPGGSFSKNWDLRHREDISSAAVRAPQSLVTATYNGELIMWRLETGQPYKKYDVSNPTQRIKITYRSVNRRGDGAAPADLDMKPGRDRGKGKESISSEQSMKVSGKKKAHLGRTSTGAGHHQARSRRVSTVVVPESCVPLRKLAVHCMVFLNSRDMDPAVGTLLVALENGNVQVWSHHMIGGFITSFSSIHKGGDYVISMTTDENDEFLFCGTSIGYIKTWLLKNYCTNTKEHVSMPKLRSQFPFMWNDILIGRAKRMVRNQPLPILLSSFKGHNMPVSGLAYINDAKILISSSADYSARMWTLGGRYLQTLGTFKKWQNVDVQLSSDFKHTIPPEISRIASSTTWKVLNGGPPSKRLTRRQRDELQAKLLTKIDYSKVYGKKLDEPVLGNYYRMSERTTLRHDIQFDSSFPHIPVYEHIIMPQAEALEIEIEEPTGDLED